MDSKWIYALFGIVLLGGLVFAISGAGVTEVLDRTRWTGNSSGNVVTEGGNITAVNVDSYSLTDKWASFYGNVTGGIVLRSNDSTALVYSWTWSAADGGEVCLTTDSNFAWASSDATTGAEVDTAWGWGAAADNATNTLNDSALCNLTFTQASVDITTAVDLQGSSTFTTCAIEDTGSPAVTGDVAFCVEINDAGTNWNAEAADYEVMVPTNDSTPTSTETYWFFVELN